MPAKCIDDRALKWVPYLKLRPTQTLMILSVDAVKMKLSLTVQNTLVTFKWIFSCDLSKWPSTDTTGKRQKLTSQCVPAFGVKIERPNASRTVPWSRRRQLFCKNKPAQNLAVRAASNGRDVAKMVIKCHQYVVKAIFFHLRSRNKRNRRYRLWFSTTSAGRGGHLLAVRVNFQARRQMAIFAFVVDNIYEAFVLRTWDLVYAKKAVSPSNDKSSASKREGGTFDLVSHDSLTIKGHHLHRGNIVTITTEGQVPNLTNAIVSRRKKKRISLVKQRMKFNCGHFGILELKWKGVRSIASAK